VVATNVGGLRDAVVNGVTGLLVPAGDPVALRSGIERVLGDPRMRSRLGLAARSRGQVLLLVGVRRGR
jgi:glycosyltransferase involved in cell wall biosynthesis